MSELYELSPYEGLCKIFRLSYKVDINTILDKSEINDAILKLSKEYIFLRCEFIEGTNKLKEIVDFKPELEYHEKILNDKEYYDLLCKYSGKIFNYTSKYFAFIDKEKNFTRIVAIFSHSMIDALSTLHLADRLLYYVSNPNKIPISRPFTSVQKQIILKESKNYEYLSKNEIYKTPLELHPCKDKSTIHYETYPAIIEPDEFNDIKTFLHNNNITYQSLLWFTSIISNIMLFKKELPLFVRFQTPATAIGRCEFNPKITEDDIVCGAAAFYIERNIQKTDFIFDSLQEISKELHKELDEKQQFYDFFSMSDYSNLPASSTTSNTLGKLDIDIHYKGKKTFDILSLSFLPLSITFPVGGINIHSYYINEIGCYLCCTYTYPFFEKDDMLSYVKNIITMMKYCSKEENKTKTINEMIKILNN